MQAVSQYLRQFIADPQLHDNLEGFGTSLASIPEWWKEVMASPRSRRTRIVLNAWEHFRPELPLIIDFLAKHLSAIYLLAENKSSRLLYELNYEGELLYYAGGNPTAKTFSPNVQKQWQNLPFDFRHFYDVLHDGWYDVASNSMGPSPSEDIFVLNDLEWGILEEIEVPECDLGSLLAVYSNGMGAYVALTTNKTVTGDVLWRKDKPPRTNIDAWGVIDAWTEMGLKN